MISGECAQDARQRKHCGEQVRVGGQQDRAGFVQQVLDVAKHPVEAARLEKARVDAVDPRALVREIRLEVIDARLKAEVLPDVTGNGLWQTQKKPGRAPLGHDLVELRGILPPPEPHQSGRMYPRNLRHDRAELGQIDVDASAEVPYELRVARNRAAHGAKGSTEAEVAELAENGPSERGRDAGKRLPDVRVAPDDLSSVPWSIAPGAPTVPDARHDDRTRLKDVNLLSGDAPFDVAGVSEVAFHAGREVAQLQELLLAERRAFPLRSGDRDFANTA